MSQKKITEDPFFPPLLIFVGALVLRLALVVFYRDFPIFRIPILDAGYNAGWARHIAEGHVWGEQVFFRAPLYPYLLGLIFFLSGNSIFVARIVQAFIGAGGAVVCYFVGLEFFKEKKIAFVGAAALAVMWTCVYFDVSLHPVVLEVPFFLLFLLFISKARTGRLKYFLLAGVFLGLSAITRPNILAFAVLVWVIFLFGRPRPSWKKWLPGLGLTYLTCVAFIIPAAVQNYAAARDFVPIASYGGLNLYMGNNPGADGIAPTLAGTKGDWYTIYYGAELKAEKEIGRTLKPSEVDRFYVGKTLSFFKEDPAAALGLLLKKAYIYTNAFEFGNCYNLNYLKLKIGLLRYDPVSLYVILPLAFLAMGVYARRRPDLLPLYLFVLTYSATVVLFYVNDKYRIPAVPAFCLFAAAGIFWFREKIRSREHKKLIIGACALTVIAAYCWITPFGIPTDPDDIQARLTLGRLYRDVGRFDEAEREMLSAYERNPDDPRVSEYLGVLYITAGETDKGAGYLEETLKRDPVNYVALTNLGVYYSGKGECKRSFGYFEKAIAAYPADPRTYLHYGDALRAAGDYEEAERAYEKLLTINPDDTHALAAMGELKYKAGNYAAAAGYFKRAAETLEKRGGNPEDAYYNLACALALQGKDDEALAYLEKAVAANPGRYREYARTDPDLASLRGLDKFENLTRQE
jgi:tetratricopeptide (TPR) repeat protein